MAMGVKTGGRTSGTPNRKTQEQITAVIESGLSPLEYLVQTYRNESLEPDVRLDAAKAAAPYVHPRLSAAAIELNPQNRPVSEWTDQQLEAAIAWLGERIEMQEEMGESAVDSPGCARVNS